MIEKIIPILVFTLFIHIGCEKSGGTVSEMPVLPDQGARILGMDVKEVPTVPYANAYNQSMSIGVREVKVSLDWKLLEPAVGNYDNILPDLINAFYPVQTGDLTLVLRPLDTPGPSLPSELTGLAYDDPAVISAFENFLSNLHEQLPDLNASGKLKWIQIGNEIDAYLGKDSNRWDQWSTFFKAAKTRVRELWGPEVQVSSIVQFLILNDPSKKNLYLNHLSELDNAVLTYYPLNPDFTVRPVSDVKSDFAKMVNEIPNKNIYLQECGYPSSELNNSNETKQADFITAVFKSWDNNINRIKIIDFTWQYDVSQETVDQWIIDFGMTGSPNENTFRSYLSTLGFNNYDGSEKLAMQKLREELQARKWEQ